jgi:predicted short-subunit dehydrogenase-like oxidoreductase (DUF2520 family)
VLIVGAGRLGAALAEALSENGAFRVTLSARRPAAARRLARRHPAIAVIPQSAAIAAARVVILAVPDRSLAPLCRELARVRASWREVVVLHAAGAYGPGLLADLARRGAATGVLHPLAAVGAGGARALRGASARIEGAGRARAAARTIAQGAGMRPWHLPEVRTPASRAAYHAAASLASNDVLALLEAAERLMARLGIPAVRARRALLVLTRGVLDRIEARGAAGALTGPASRGDLGTLGLQVEALARFDPDAAEAHRALSRRLAGLAAESGRLDRAAAARVRRALARGRGRARTV